MSEKKILFLDLDGTLLSTFKKISKKNLNALREFSKLGHEIIISTGKTYENTIKYINKINNVIDNKIKFCSCMNGNIIMDLRYNRERVLYENYISNKNCQFIYHICRRFKLVFAPYTKYGINKGNIHTTSTSLIFNIINKFNVTNWKIKSIRSYQYMLAYKINIFTKNIFNTKKLKNAYKELNKNPNIEILKTRPFFYEIVAKDSNKGYALKFLAKILNVSIKKTIAIGDSYNDLPMFKIAGTSISVGNNSYEFKKYCKYTLKNKRNKVYYALKKLKNPD